MPRSSDRGFLAQIGIYRCVLCVIARSRPKAATWQSPGATHRKVATNQEVVPGDCHGLRPRNDMLIDRFSQINRPINENLQFPCPRANPNILFRGTPNYPLSSSPSLFFSLFFQLPDPFLSSLIPFLFLALPWHLGSTPRCSQILKDSARVPFSSSLFFPFLGMISNM